MYTIDDADRRILTELQKDPRLSNAALSERVGLSPTPCLRRVKRLHDTGVVSGELLLVDPSRVGLHIEAMVSIRLEKHGNDITAPFEQAIARIPEVLSCFLVAGVMDFIAHTAAPNLSTHTLLVKKIASLQGVADIRSDIILQKTKPWTSTPV
ncbi:Lrp/AsnC family transcriptional regulator [Epibacterium sp. Ofav1-8]|uniref:Lrp/AsnC family transcriptional regulator n=1 Tax=Epibacterium sp. Ofav1-8 TaxID=2917735 RepID=UPI001EF43049|nr:Lrp/AsnC family transcriptional regulator [Epibacterium sp. Ofav1-8]MCG7626075.1 Lrp/AsnC family transcriptional regulator [Epibacterium sp. Ofav1-8]